jgi:hypothetical protein
MGGVNFSTLLYLPVFDQFARTVTINPIVSQPSQPPYENRGIYTTEPIDIQAIDGSIFSDQRTILDIREVEYSILPVQGDLVFIPADNPGPELGWFEVHDADSDGGGETTLLLRKIVPAKP